MKHSLLSICCALVALGILAGAAPAAPLDQILGIVPRDLTNVMLMFTDWSQIKNQLGLETVTSQSPLADRLELARRASQDLATASAYGLFHIEAHALTWGWDTADLEWEANILSSEFPPIYFLKLRDDFDFSTIAMHFTERGFIQTESQGAVVYTHEFAVSADWMRTTELSILTTAYIEEDDLMILSSSPAAVSACLAARAGEFAVLNENPFASAAVQHLEAPNSAIILLGLGECLRFTPNPIHDLIGTIPTHERIAELKTMMEERELLVPYRALGVGYHLIDAHPVGTIVFEYDAPELAAADLPARILLAEEGMSRYFDAPISESYFTVLACDTKDNAIVMTVAPINAQPSRLFRMIFYVDAVFAGCST